VQNLFKKDQVLEDRIPVINATIFTDQLVEEIKRTVPGPIGIKVGPRKQFFFSVSMNLVLRVEAIGKVRIPVRAVLR
jgi:hypothetical protein